MMGRTTQDRRSIKAGRKGRNRVRVFLCPKTGKYRLELRRDGRKLSRTLGHSDHEQAEREAEEAAALLLLQKSQSTEEVETQPLVLGELFEMYQKERTPEKSDNSQRYDRRAMEMFGRYFGRNREVRTLARRDFDRFIRDRREGRIGPAQRPGASVGPRIAEQDLRLLNAIFNWATVAGDGNGRALLHRNPFKGFPLPREKNPLRVVLTQSEYDAMLAVSAEMDWRFHVALVLAHETGHRAGAIAELRWSDVDFDAPSIHWRAETEKTGYAHTTPITPEALEALRKAEKHRTEENGPILPSPGDPSRGLSRHLMRDWWKRAERRAGLEPKKGRGWHSLRRKFASDLMDQPLKVLAELGGWKEPATILKCYQHPDQDVLKAALASRSSR